LKQAFFVRARIRGCAAARLALIVVVICGGFVATAERAGAEQSTVDRRVTHLSASALLTQPASVLVDARRQHAALRLRRYTRPLFGFWALSQIGAFFCVWAFGYGARLRDAASRAIGNTFAMRFTFAAVLTLVGAAASIPASFARYRVDLGFGTSAERAASWIRDGFVNAAVEAAVVGAVVACIFALVDRTRIWYAYAMAGLFVVTLFIAFLEPVTVAPLYNHFVPLGRKAPIRAPLEALAKRAGVYRAPVYVADASRRTRSVTADIAGFGPTKRIVLGDALLADATPGEVLFLAARELGHYAHGDDFRLSLFWTFLFIFASALAVVIADRVGFRNDDDALARLPLVFALMGLIGLVLVPVYNGYSRNIESRADAYALALTRNRVAAIRAYVRIADETLDPLCPARLARLYFLNSPPIGTRIARVQRRRNPCP